MDLPSFFTFGEDTRSNMNTFKTIPKNQFSMCLNSNEGKLMISVVSTESVVIVILALLTTFLFIRG